MGGRAAALMDLIWPTLGTVAGIGGAARLFNILRRPVPRLPYRHQESLLTAAEQRFYLVLAQSVAQRWVICAKVRLADLVSLPDETPQRRVHLNRITNKHIDFVLCHPTTLAPLLAVELDDSSHTLPHRQQRDIFVNAVLQTAGLPLLRVPVQATYAASDLARQIAQMMGRAARR